MIVPHLYSTANDCTIRSLDGVEYLDPGVAVEAEEAELLGLTLALPPTNRPAELGGTICCFRNKV